MTLIPSTIGEFSILPISIPALSSYPHPAIHYIYVRRHAPRAPKPDDSRSLFWANVPADSTEIHLRGLVTALVGAGRFESAEFHDDGKSSEAAATSLPPPPTTKSPQSKKRKRGSEESERAKEEEAARLPTTWLRPLRRSGSSAVVKLADEKSVERVLKAISKLQKTRNYPKWGEGVPEKFSILGSSWFKAHGRLTYPDKDAVEQAVNSFFVMFDRKEQEAAELAKRLRNEPDEDGFVTVTRGARNAPARRDEAEEARRKMLDKADKKKAELSNFYRFQLREQKKAEQTELLKRFDEDKKKISAMREKRTKFMPET
jgi:ribosomal RNA-processing protein 7